MRESGISSHEVFVVHILYLMLDDPLRGFHRNNGKSSEEGSEGGWPKHAGPRGLQRCSSTSLLVGKRGLLIRKKSHLRCAIEYVDLLGQKDCRVVIMLYLYQGGRDENIYYIYLLLLILLSLL